MSFAIPRIISALAQGYPISQIINHLIKTKNPLAKTVKEALKQGYTPDQIGEYLTKGRSKSYGEQQRMLSGMTEKEKGERIANYQPAMERAAIQALPKAAGALGAYALGRAVPSILQQLTPQLTQSPISPAPPDAPAVGQPQLPVDTPQPTAPMQPIQQQTPPIQSQPTISASQILQQMGIKERVDNMLKSGNTPESISAVLTAQGKKAGVTDQELINTIAQYAKEKPVKPLTTIEKPHTIQETKVEPKTDKLIALLPKGEVGEVESVKDGIAKINVDGQIRHRKEEDFIESPLPQKELADLYNDLISGIEIETGQEVSRNVYWAGYDPKTNELAYLPHDGGFYVYDDISEEDKKELTSILNTRKSTGDNYVGAWTAGSSSPIGAAMFRLIQRLQKERGGKGKEYSGKFEKIYDALEPAKKAAKKKHAEKTKKTKKPGSR